MPRSKPAPGFRLCSACMIFMQGPGRFVPRYGRRLGDIVRQEKSDVANVWKVPAMRLTIEIVAAALLVVCISASSAAFAAGKMGRTADGVSCGFSVPANA